jgi:hypothetical protein
MTPNDLLASAYRMARQMVHMMTDDLTADEFRRQPLAGANSAAWIVGHLAVTARRTALRLGATGLPELTEEYVAQYSATRKTAESQAELGEKAELLNLFDVSIEKLMEAVRAIPAESLDAPPAATPFAANYAEAVLFGGLHVALHCGQLSTIRRSLGKPPLV